MPLVGGRCLGGGPVLERGIFPQASWKLEALDYRGLWLFPQTRRWAVCSVLRNLWTPKEVAGTGEGLDYFFLGCYSLELEPCPPVLFPRLCICSLNLRADLEWSPQEAQDVCRGILLNKRPALSTWLATDQGDYSAFCCPKHWNTWESPGQKVTLKPYD